MTGENIYLEVLNPYSNSYVTFDGGARGKINGIGKMVRSGFPCLDYVLFGRRINC